MDRNRPVVVAHSTAPPADGRLITPLFVLVTASALCYFTAISTMLPVLPRYVEDELDGSGLAVGIAVGAFAVSAALVRPVSGRLGDVLGRRFMAVAGAVIAAVATFPLGLVAALWYLVLLRLVMGLGEAAFFIGAATAAQDLAPDDRRGEATSFFSIAIYGGLAIGPFVGEVIYQRTSAETVFVVAGLLLIVSAALGMGIPRDLGKVDDAPPRRGLLHPAALLPGAVLLLGLFGFSGFSAFVPIYIDDIGVEDAGPFFLAYGVIVLVVRIFGAKIPDRLGAVRCSSLALVFIGVGVGSVASVASVSGLWVGTVLLALGMSLLFPALFTLAVSAAPASERSHAVGTFSLFFDLSQGLGAPALGLVVTLVDDERGAFVGGAAMAAVGLVVSNTALRRLVAERSTPDRSTPVHDRQ